MNWAAYAYLKAQALRLMAAEQMARFDRRKEQKPNNVVDLESVRRDRWLIKHTRPLPQKGES